MRASFKQFVDLIDSDPEQLSEEQLTEIFGAFFGKKSPATRDEKVAQLKAEKERLEKLRAAKWAQAKQATQTSITRNMKPVPTGHTSAAAQGRAAEQDWMAGIGK